MKSCNLFAPRSVVRDRPRGGDPGRAADHPPAGVEEECGEHLRDSTHRRHAGDRVARRQGAAQAGNFYVIDWEARGSLPGSDGQGQFILELDNKVFPIFEVGREWNRYRNWFYSGKKVPAMFFFTCAAARSSRWSCATSR
ncbi:MAG: hypothetical protein L6W00_23420 [Lentisphaeria bacterium]|nr:MAG: hypothetical protein L6W00_23420 [Lentisphaeria bacterium]